MTVHLVSCGVSVAPPPVEADMVFDCLNIPDPSPVVHDLPGTEPVTASVIETANPLVTDYLSAAAMSVQFLHELRGSDILVVFACSAGWHRSVYAAEKVAGMLCDAGIQVRFAHRDLGTEEL